jgi:hypothetical protein
VAVKMVYHVVIPSKILIIILSHNQASIGGNLRSLPLGKFIYLLFVF